MFGAGPIGLMTIEALKAAGAAQIYAVEVAPSRKAKAEALGAMVIDPQQEDAVEKLHALSGGGVDDVGR